MKDISEVIKIKTQQRDQLAADITILQRALILLQDENRSTDSPLSEPTITSNPHGRWP